MKPKLVMSQAELVALIRERRDELGLTHEGLDSLTGMAGGYTSKLLAPTPIRGLGPMSLTALMSAMAIGVAAVVIAEDPAQTERMKARWIKRKQAPARGNARHA